MGRASSIALVLLLTVMGAIALAVVLIPAVTGTKVITIDRNSMQRVLPFGTLAYIEPAPSYDVGDIVTFTSGDKYVTHEIVALFPNPATAELDGSWVRTKGTENTDPDEPISADRIVGRVIFHTPYAGIGLKTLGALPVQMFLVTLAVFLWWFGSEPSRTQRRITEMKRQRDEANMPPPQRRLDGIRDMTVQRAAEPIHAYRASDVPLRDEPVTEEYL
jgi:signal peptidase I